MQCQDHVAHGTSQLYHSVWSLLNLHSLEPTALKISKRPIPRDITYTYIVPHLLYFITTGFRGVDVCAETALVVTNTPKDCMYVWEGYGLMLRVPKDCLPPGTEKCTISIKASVSGEYEFPDNSHPVSPIFWIRCEPSCRFRLPVSVKLQHCGKQNDVSKLSFVKAHCSQEDLPYHFKRLHGHQS